MDNFEQFLLYQKELTEFKLKTINRYLKPFKPQPQKVTNDALRKSQKTKTSLIEQILIEAGRPLTIKEIAEIADREHKVQMKRDSMSSILTKKIQAGVAFIRTGPNTFGLKDQS
jgi:transposase